MCENFHSSRSFVLCCSLHSSHSLPHTDRIQRPVGQMSHKHSFPSPARILDYILVSMAATRTQPWSEKFRRALCLSGPLLFLLNPDRHLTCHARVCRRLPYPIVHFHLPIFSLFTGGAKNVQRCEISQCFRQWQKYFSLPCLKFFV